MTIVAQSPTRTSVSRYHPLVVGLHWLLAALVIAALALGALVMARIPNTDPMKLEALRSHMAGGSAIVLLMLIRLVARLRTAHPGPAATGSQPLDRLAWLSHRLLYVLVIAQGLSGLTLALQAHLPAIVFAGEGSLPADLWVYPLRSVHYALSRALMMLIALHIVGAAYHILFLRDGLLRRMSFGRRAASAPSDQQSRRK